MTSEAEVLWILLVPRLRSRADTVRLATEEPPSSQTGPTVRTRTNPGARPPEGRKSGVYETRKLAVR